MSYGRYIVAYEKNGDLKGKELVMLNEILKKVQSDSVSIRTDKVRISDTGIAEDSANLGPRRLARQRFQRMRRRHQRAASSAYPATGWVARIA